uniref:non-specific serine/threonine protein kinase n=1 Tax=Loa loa TaxID=7209 RepID=A0A1I7VL66_LOALO
MDLIDMSEGKVVSKRWVIDEKLGEGSCATVYKVHDLNDTRVKAALKVEARSDDNYSVLKKEVAVMRKLQSRRHTVRVYSYVVMSLLGPNLIQLKKMCKVNTFTAGTTNRIGVHALYAIKQLHEIGYVHRDIKPANMVIGRRGHEARIIYLIDYGMAREYAIWEEGYARIRRQREHVLMRGTTRYCSPAVHARMEQGRKDDLWSLVYVLVELHAGLPWRGITEKEVGIMKDKITDEVLMADCPPEWVHILKYIRTLTYESRPDYKKIYDLLMNCMKRLSVSFSDPYDWEMNFSSKSSRTTTTIGTTRATAVITKDSANRKSLSNRQLYDFPPTTNPKEFECNDIGI